MIFSIRGSIRPRLNLIFLEDIPNCLTADLLNPEFPQFRNDSRVAVADCLGDFDHKVSELTRFPLVPLGFLFLGSPLLVPKPSKERSCRDGRVQLFDRSTGQ